MENKKDYKNPDNTIKGALKGIFEGLFSGSSSLIIGSIIIVLICGVIAIIF